MGDGKHKFQSEDLKGHYWEDSGADRRIILEYI
jgi:hypothetical protein